MYKKLLDYAYHHSLEVVETTEGNNGYPLNLKKLIIGFESFKDAQECAKAINGGIFFISKRDGHEFWKNEGRAFGPLEINDKWFDDDHEVIREVSASQWWEDTYADLKETVLPPEGVCPTPDKLIEIIQTFQNYSNVYEMIQDLEANEQIYYERGFPQHAEIVPIYTMHHHDFDVHDYAVAVSVN